MTTVPLRAEAPLREEQLTRLWEGQTFPPEVLRTRCGELLQVVYRGLRGRGPGPDFRDAIIARPDGQLLQGDLEIHVKASDFYAHGHHLDPAYNNLILHLVFRDDGQDTILASGQRVIVIALAPWLAQREADLERWLSSPRRWREPCCDALRLWGEGEIAATLDHLGDRRFAEKAAAFSRSLMGDGGEEVLYTALVEAVGYGANRLSFRALAAAMPWATLQRLLGTHGVQEETAEAFLLGAAGVLARPTSEPYAQALQRVWQREGGISATIPELWRVAGVRPANNPQRRIAGLARLLTRYAHVGLVMGLRDVVTVADAPSSLVAALTVPAEGFWSDHLDLTGRPWRRAPALVGSGRAIELAVNAVLPFLAAWDQRWGDGRLEKAALALYRQLPRSASYGVVSFLEANLGGTKLTGSARRQQALLYLLQHYCRRGGCGRCPIS